LSLRVSCARRVQLIEADVFGEELAETITGDFMTVTDLNHALGKLYTALAQNRISSRNVNALARIGRTMLSTIPGIKTEFKIELLFRPVERDAEGHQASF
jgi:hypothetical protein